MNINKMREQDPESADIYEDVQDAVKTILSRRSALDDEGLTDVPLFIAIGETHDCSAHLLHNSLLLEALAAKEPSIAVGIEQAHNKLQIPSKSREELNDKEYGIECLKHAVSSSATLTADHANRFFLRSILNHSEGVDRFAAIFNDAASRDNAYLDLSDDKTFAVYKTFFETATRSDDVHVVSAEGAFIRNVFMADQLKTLAEAQNARIAIQFCGHGHIAGHKFWAPENSLVGCFNQMNAPFLALFMPHEDMMAAPEVLTDEYKIISERVPYVKTIYRPATGTLDPNLPEDKLLLDEESPDIISREAEQEYINTKLEFMGMGDRKLYVQARPL